MPSSRGDAPARCRGCRRSAARSGRPARAAAITAARACGLTVSPKASRPQQARARRVLPHQPGDGAACALRARRPARPARRGRRRARAAGARCRARARAHRPSPSTPRPGSARSLARPRRLRARARAALSSTARASGCSLGCCSAAASRSTASRAARHRDAPRRHQRRPAFGQRAGLVERDACRPTCATSSASASLIRMPCARGDAGAGHDRGRRRQAERARAGDDQHRDRVEDRLLPVAAGDDPAERTSAARCRAPPARRPR